MGSQEPQNQHISTGVLISQLRPPADFSACVGLKGSAGVEAEVPQTYKTLSVGILLRSEKQKQKQTKKTQRQKQQTKNPPKHANPGKFFLLRPEHLGLNP